MKFFQHFKTVSHHRFLVMKGCFAVGLYKQGLMHDLSKFSPTEFMVGARYYQGNRSPNNAERERIGYSSAWLHHKGRNKHHYEYWIDYSASQGVGMVPAKMPIKYVAEMMMDRIAAAKVYNKKDYKSSDPLQYFLRGKEHTMMHKETKELLEKWLHMLSEQGEEKTFAYIRKCILKQKQ